MKILNFVVPAILLLFAAPTSAHHSSSAYDFSESLSLTGEVMNYEWKNPHVYISLAHQDEDGVLSTWLVEAFPLAFMRRTGWTAETLEPGDRISLAVFPGKDRSRHIAFLSPQQTAEGLLQDTTSYFAAAVDTTATGTALSIAGTWAGVRAPEAMATKDWPLTDAAVEALENFQDNDLPASNCVPGQVPDGLVFPDFKRIGITDREIIIQAEFALVDRVIHMDRESHENAEFSIQGHSIGRWEDDVLIVDTSNFLEHRSGNGYGIPSSRQKHLTERFELDDEGELLTYHFELSDPVFLSEPVEREMQWVYRPDVEFSLPECDLENARRFLGN